jgi:hypothetical protein
VTGVAWHTFREGGSLGTQGSEGGTIVADEEHGADARITLERAGRNAPYAVTCSLNGWMVHTRFFDSLPAAEAALAEMKEGLAAIIRVLRSVQDLSSAEQLARVSPRLQEFVERFP